MKFNKIVSILLAVITLLSSFSILAYAEGEEQGPVYEYDTSEMQPIDYFTGKVIEDIVTDSETGETTIIYKEDEEGNTVVIETAEDKLEAMDLRLEKDGYQLYVDAYSGEVATRCIETGEILFSNPYDVASSKATDTVKAQLLSQLSVTFTTITSDEQTTYHSYTWASLRDQIKVKNIKNGIRIEYSIGRAQSKMLVPMLIEASSFEKNIHGPLKEGLGEGTLNYDKFMVYYQDKSTMPKDTLNELYKKYPNLEKMDNFYMLINLTEVEKLRLENWIKTYAPDYTYEALDEDHLKVGYESEDDNPPLFKMALEYSLDSQGLSVRLPANGIRFNESLYRLDNIEILPYMGAAATPNSGYTLFPDGSGALFDYEKIKIGKTTYNVSGTIYGEDYAYHTITSTHQEAIRYPVYGIVDTTTDKDGDTTSRGFFAIVEEGDAMMELCSSHEINAHEYNSVKMRIFPRPQDEYNMADAISVGTNSTWTVVSSRKYTGVYKVRYVMLTSEKTLAEKNLDSSKYYDTSYIGMANAYRDYLTNNGILTKLTSEDVKKDIPLYIETFGAIETTEKFLSIPIDVMTPLTSFEDIKTMYDDLSAEGITNINFIMTGYANGGMYSTAPYNLDWENAVGGEKGFEELVAYAKEKGFGLYPDFDFAFVSTTAAFDGLDLKDHVVKTIDNRYTSKREYSATKQTHISYFELAISPAYFSHFYEKLTENYVEYAPIGISVSSLGTYLNSDFDEDEPYNREDSKEFTVEAFKYFDENYENVMTSGGNAYTWKYVDYITDIALDSSRYSRAGASVPFLGIVLHGSIQYSGTAINMEGNIDYALLKAIESGAGLNFILSYRNTENLKDSEILNKYYSVRYDIWFNDVVSLYNELNGLLADVQTSYITDHQFIEGTRVADDDELSDDAQSAMERAIAFENALIEAYNEEDRILLRDARIKLENIYNELNASIDNVNALYNSFKSGDGTGEYSEAELDLLILAVSDAKTALENASESEKNAARNELAASLEDLRTFITSAYSASNTLATLIEDMKNDAEYAERAYARLVEDGSLSADLMNACLGYKNEIVARAAAVVGLDTEIFEYLTTTLWNKVSDIEDLNVTQYTIPTFSEETKSENSSDFDIVEGKYASDDNKIVYIKYENGKSFLLNFNSYMVRVEKDGVVYTIKAYGYLVMTDAN